MIRQKKQDNCEAPSLEKTENKASGGKQKLSITT
jgi:hypothetical protein